MPEFSLHVRLDATESDPEDADAILSAYAEDYDDVSLGNAELNDGSDGDFVVPSTCLEIEGVEVFAEVYQQLADEPAVYDVSLWGPTAERYPLLVEHYALQHLSTPESYEFYALDNQRTLVIADKKRAYKRAQEEVPPAAVGR